MAAFFFLVSLCLGGVGVSGYLSVSHYRNFMDIGYQSFCAISKALNCDTVSQSIYAVFFGVPLGVWGIAGYLVFLFFMAALFPGKNKKTIQAWAAGLFVIAAVFSGFSLFLAAIATFEIHSYCLMCIVLYGINFALLFISWLIWKRAGDGKRTGRLKNTVLFFREKISRIVLIGVGFLIVSGSLVLFYPKYWRFPELSASAGTGGSSGTTDEGSPWIGAENPVLTIEEYADYMCFQCGKMHGYLRKLVNQYPDKIRLVHRHFPLDNKVNPVLKENVHPNAGLVALFAIASEDTGMFWQANDLLFRDAREKKEINIKEIGEKLGLDVRQVNTMVYNAKTVSRLQADIRSGLKAGITATPSYIIDGTLYEGSIPVEILDRVVKEK
ncbi:thioredoxin domain-containing protein [Desulfosarcina sp. OttesenSCG-928-B08]|nr:thioredoxin domain-containing protein [Desulfosarcina sp. OttesenSCG-928-B08]